MFLLATGALVLRVVAVHGMREGTEALAERVDDLQEEEDAVLGYADKAERQRIFAKWFAGVFGDVLEPGRAAARREKEEEDWEEKKEPDLAAKKPPGEEEPGPVLLDVAGGRGDLSLELWRCTGIQPFLVDPREEVRADMAGRHLRCCFEYPLREQGVEVEKLRSVLGRAVAVAGMHPDEATDAIVDWAIATSTPFAVVTI